MIANLICRQNEYDGVDEMWVTIKETGKKLSLLLTRNFTSKSVRPEECIPFFRILCAIYTLNNPVAVLGGTFKLLQGLWWTYLWLWRWWQVCHDWSWQGQDFCESAGCQGTPEPAKQICPGTACEQTFFYSHSTTWVVLFRKSLAPYWSSGISLSHGLNLSTSVLRFISMVLLAHAHLSCQSKEALKKFMDSLISRTGKLRSLARDLETKFDDPAATSCPSRMTHHAKIHSTTPQRPLHSISSHCRGASIP